MPKTAAPPKPWTSGYCNITLPRTAAYDPHQRCPGCTGCRAPNCPCNPEEPPVLRSEIVPPDEAPYDMVAQKRAYDAEDAAENSPEAAVAAVKAAADRLNAALLGYGPDDWHDALTLLRDLRRATTLLGQIDANLIQWTYLHGEHGKRVVDGIGEVWVTRGRAKEHWEGDEAARAYVEARIRENDGEMPDPDQVVAWVLEVVPAAKCRVTPLRAVGLEVEDYRTSLPGNLQVTVPLGDPS